MLEQTLRMCLLDCCIVPEWVSTEAPLMTSSMQNWRALRGFRLRAVWRWCVGWGAVRRGRCGGVVVQ